ncbi:hypothetical protein OZ664_05860 [Elizabethkingia sp. HX WHF]|uniref:hypothetical protein n=1 Tax=Elizabethkingia TaxID=308865 RepID=UPI0005D8FF34|nr:MULTISPECIES: hypothetical protein [Elizabethkingia]AJW62089.1 hypothetical protein VO54_00602 [Elizabethkingia miricola]ATL42692.1 hypothetical protein CQS02_04915 [Elizabethkingia miricola]MCL1637247.1 hypothetical protein [Elizabethkingia bruuniana]MDX8563518.1 hypothetical protein [Elizabethkingia sp. HX WHF]OPC19979.1 hypothetical protein BAY00_10780 [Elizabethkingia bruuniana]
MDILKLSTEWAKAELVSAKIVWLFSLVILLSAGGFSLWGKTIMAKAFIIPLIVSGVLLIAVGTGLYAANKPRLAQFEKDYKSNTANFLEKEINRTMKSDHDFKMVFIILPAIAIIAAILLMLFPTPNWRAASITTILLVTFLMGVDSNTSARNNVYLQQLLKSSVS